MSSSPSWSSLWSSLCVDQSNWLQHVHSSLSSSTLLLASPKASNVAMVDKERGVRLVAFDKDDEMDEMSAVALLTIPQMSRASHSDQSFVVLGFQSGKVSILSSGSHLLFHRQLNASPVRSLRIAFATLHVVYNHCVLLLELKQLSELLLSNSKLAARASSGLMSGHEYASNLHSSSIGFMCKKWLVNKQDVYDVAIVSHNSSAFERWQIMAMEGSAVCENSLRVFKQVNHLVTVGSLPCYRFNSAYSMRAKDLNELAESVVGSVKTGLSRMFFSSQTKSAEPQETVHKLSTVHEYYDNGKCIKQVEVCPNNLYLAMRDDVQHRVMVLDAVHGFLLHLWKGYHHVQLAWISVKDCVNTFLLAIYIPRRGSLEIWSVERKVRLAEFEVSKQGLLMTPNDSNDVVFVDKEGEWHSVIVPKEALSGDSKRDDYVQEQMLVEKFRDQSLTTVSSDIIPVLDKTKSAGSKVSILICCMQEGLNEKEMRLLLQNCLDKLNETRSALENDVGGEHPKDEESGPENSSSLSLMEGCTKTLMAILDFHDTISKMKNSDVGGENDEDEKNDPSEILKCGETDLEKLKSLVSESSEASSSTLTLQTVSNFFNLSVASLSKSSFKGKSRSLLKTEANTEVFNGLLRNVSSSLSLILPSLSSASSLLQFSLNSWMAANGHDFKDALNLHKLINCIYHICNETKEDIKELTLTTLQQIHTDHAMSSSLAIFLFVYKHFLALLENTMMSEELVNETDLRLQLCLKFLKIETAFAERHSTIVAKWSGYTMSKLYVHSSVPDEIAKWIVMADYDFNFVGSCANVFPLSCQNNTLLAHVIWVSFEEWKKSRNVEYLQKAAFYLDKAASNSQWLSHQLSLVLYRSALERLGVEIVSVCESPSEAKCVRDVGVGLNELSNVLLPVLKLVSELLNDLEGDVKDLLPPEKMSKEDFYDEICLRSNGTKRQLIDQVLQTASRTQVDASLLSLQLQFFIASAMIAHFKKFGDVKPLQLFNVQESNSFFQTGHSSLSMEAPLAILNVTQNHVVRGARRRFMSDMSLAVVECIVFEMNEEGERVSVLQEYSVWLKWLLRLADLWHMTDKAREMLVNHLFRQGHDTLGHEILGSLENSSHLQGLLLHVSVLRVSKLVFESEHDELNKNVVRVKPSLAEKLSEFQSEAANLPATNVEDTQALLIHVCNNTEEKQAQLAYELLSVIRTFAIKLSNQKGDA